LLSPSALRLRLRFGVAFLSFFPCSRACPLPPGSALLCYPLSVCSFVVFPLPVFSFPNPVFCLALVPSFLFRLLLPLGPIATHSLVFPSCSSPSCRALLVWRLLLPLVFRRFSFRFFRLAFSRIFLLLFVALVSSPLTLLPCLFFLSSSLRLILRLVDPLPLRASFAFPFPLLLVSRCFVWELLSRFLFLVSLGFLWVASVFILFRRLLVLLSFLVFLPCHLSAVDSPLCVVLLRFCFLPSWRPCTFPVCSRPSPFWRLAAPFFLLFAFVFCFVSSFLLALLLGFFVGLLPAFVCPLLPLGLVFLLRPLLCSALLSLLTRFLPWPRLVLLFPWLACSSLRLRPSSCFSLHPEAEERELSCAVCYSFGSCTFSPFPGLSLCVFPCGASLLFAPPLAPRRPRFASALRPPRAHLVIRLLWPSFLVSWSFRPPGRY